MLARLLFKGFFIASLDEINISQFFTLFSSVSQFNRDVLGVEYLTDHMDGAGDDNKVNKGSSADKTRSNYRKQDRKYRQMNADTMYDGGDYED